MDIKSGRLPAREVRDHWRDVVDYVREGNHVVVERNGKPLIAIIPIEDFNLLKSQFEDMYDNRLLAKELAEYMAIRETDPDPVMERLLVLRAEHEADQLAKAQTPVLETT